MSLDEKYENYNQDIEGVDELSECVIGKDRGQMDETTGLMVNTNYERNTVGFHPMYLNSSLNEGGEKEDRDMMK